MMLFCMLLSMCNMEAFGVPYTALLAPGSSAVLRDGLLRRNWRRLAQADFTVRDMPKDQPAGEAAP